MSPRQKCGRAVSYDSVRKNTSALLRLPHILRESRGWRRRLAAMVCGLCATAALPPVGIALFLIPAFCGLLWLLEGSGNQSHRFRAAWGVGWWFGFAHFFSGLYWIAEALWIDPARHGWLVPIALTGLPALFACYCAAVTWLAHWWGGRGIGQVLAFASLWTGSELLRGSLLSGFPWNLIGYAWSGSLSAIQLAALTGIWGLTLLAVLIAALPTVIIDDRASRRERWVAASLAAGLLASVWIGGAVRLAHAPAIDTRNVPGVRLRLVQANIEQRLKWRPEQAADILAKYIRLSRGSDLRGVTHVIWPEAALPFVLSDDTDHLLRRVSGALRPAALIAGAVRTSAAADSTVQAWNSLAIAETSGRITLPYDKHHLVPFGEYVPARRFLKIAKVTEGETDLSAGPGPRTVKLDGLPLLSPLICYEAIFPQGVVARGPRPAWLLNLTNDAWFGRSAGPYQHFESARMRAIEEGLPLVRVAATGISAVVDPYGRVTASLALGQEGTLDTALPAALPEPTLYASVGNRWILVVLLLVMLLSFALSRRQARPHVRRKKTNICQT